jgi:hypothetical protein
MMEKVARYSTVIVSDRGSSGDVVLDANLEDLRRRSVLGPKWCGRHCWSSAI